MIEIKNLEREKVILVGLKKPQTPYEVINEHLNELELLADTAGADVLLKITQERAKIDPAYFIGKGKSEELKQLVELNEVDSVIFDDDLNPTQVRNLERLIDRKILDRSGLILDIFASHARSNESKLQVELAQLQYMLPRLTRAWTHLSKQYGGIGTKGPGETQIETDRRIIRTRISKLKAKLQSIEKQQKTKSKGRKSFLTASLVGYTNAGKSTLLNLLTGADTLSEDKLFATLDSITRIYPLDNKTKVLMSDTVGFIRKLPQHLIASFKSTLNVVRDADVILHVIDISHKFFEEQIEITDAALKELGCGKKPQIKIFNKVDKLNDRTKLNYTLNKYPDSIAVSAARGINVRKISELLSREYELNFAEHRMDVSTSNSKLISYIHSLAEVISMKYDADTAHVHFRSSRENLNKIMRMKNEK